MTSTEWNPEAGMVVTPDLATAPSTTELYDDSADREGALDELVWLLTKAGPFGSARERAANVLQAITTAPYGGLSGAAYRYVDTLARAKRDLQAGLADGTHCPCCGQRAQLYHRALNSGMAAALVVLTRESLPGEWVHKPTVLRGLGASARDEALLRYWELLEDSLEVREDGGKNGWWRVTPKGRAFVEDPSMTVPKYVNVYSGQSHGLDGPPITIVDALGQRFNYGELLRGV